MNNVRNSISLHARELARQALQANPLYIDTETTGLEKNDEIIEISVVNDQANVVFSSLVRPSRPIPPSAFAIHGISNEMVRTAPLWPNIWNQLKNILMGRLVAFYNSEFDLRMMTQSFQAYRQPWQREFQECDIMKIYSEYRADWDPQRMSYRLFKLEEAGRYFSINIPNAHRATSDTLLSRAVLHCIAEIAY